VFKNDQAFVFHPAYNLFLYTGGEVFHQLISPQTVWKAMKLQHALASAPKASKISPFTYAILVPLGLQGMPSA